MKVILYMATSINGNITFGKSDSDWVDKADWETFHKLIIDSKLMVMGSVTYKQFADDFPQKGALNVVVTHNKKLLSKNVEGALFTDLTPTEIVYKFTKDGYEQIALIGGQTLNTAFIKDNLVDEIYIDIHPYLIGEGLRLVGEINKYFRKLKLLDVKTLENDLVLLHYEVIKQPELDLY